MSDAQKLSLFGVIGPIRGSSISGFSLDAADESIAFCFHAQTTDPITHVGLRFISRTGTTSLSYVVSLEALDASGNPDGVALASAVISAPGNSSLNGVWQWIALSSSYSPSAIGQPLAVVVRYSSGTISGSNFVSFTSLWPGFGHSSGNGFPYRSTLTASAWTKSDNSFAYGYKTASSVYGKPAQALFTTTTSTTGQRQAAKINIPTTFGTSFKIRGVLALIRAANASQSYKIGIWNSAGTELASAIGTDADQSSTVAAEATVEAFFSSMPTLTTGVDYYYGIESVSGSTVGLRGQTMASADDRAAFPLGLHRCLSTWNGSSWTDDTTTLPMLELILDDITVPSGSGGAIVIGSYGPLVRGL